MPRRRGLAADDMETHDAWRMHGATVIASLRHAVPRLWFHETLFFSVHAGHATMTPAYSPA